MEAQLNKEQEQLLALQEKSFFVDLTAAAVAVAGVDWIVVEGIFWLFPETSTLFCLSATILIPAEFVGFLPFFDGDTLSAGTDDVQVT